MGFLNLDVKYKPPKILAVIFTSLCFANGLNQAYPQWSIHRELLGPNQITRSVEHRSIHMNNSKHNTAPSEPIEPKLRIIGGHSCGGRGNESIKHVVAITTFFGYPICTGSLVSSKWVLTAAHCGSIFAVYYVTPAHVRDRCMSAKGVEDFLPMSCPSMRVSSWYYHPFWKPRGMLNDIALLKLASPIHSKDSVKYVKLPSYPVKATGPDLCPETTVMGFGRLSKYTPKKPKKTMCLNLKLVYEKDCKKLLFTFLTINLNTKICSNSSTKEDVCHGDSGGPMMCGDTQIGISSYLGKPSYASDDPAVFTSIGCASGYPAVFTRVDRHLKFITDILNKGTPTIDFNFLYFLSFYFAVINILIII